MQGITDGKQDAVNLRILVYKEEGVGDVVVAHVDDARADPRPDTALRLVQDGVHHARGFGTGLNAVKALAGVAQAVADAF